MIKRDYHIHTNLCDGKDTPEDIVLAAIDKGFDTIGFSGHSPLGSEYWCMSEENTTVYNSEIQRLKEKYNDKIEIFRGLEQDYYSETVNKEDYDYIIGSVHGLKVSGGFVFMDDTAGALLKGIDEHFCGDPLLLAEKYFETLSDVVNKTGADIVGHFDLLLKFQESNPLFDTNHPRYINAAKSAVDKLSLSGVLFEVNTGAMSRGYRSTPYPEKQILSYLKEKGCDVILTSDCHNKDYLGFAFSDAVTLLKDCGFARIAYLSKGQIKYKEI